jgi:hypothetical protein
MPKRISKQQILAQFWSGYVRRDMGTSDWVEGQEPLYTAGGPTDYLCSAKTFSFPNVHFLVTYVIYFSKLQSLANKAFGLQYN